jgi:hypothetical protein
LFPTDLGLFQIRPCDLLHHHHTPFLVFYVYYTEGV